MIKFRYMSMTDLTKEAFMELYSQTQPRSHDRNTLVGMAVGDWVRYNKDMSPSWGVTNVTEWCREVDKQASL